MLTNREMIMYLESINERLKQKQLSGQICLFGGAAMCLVFGSRSHLTITAASPEYLFSMKCLASRMIGSKDLEDIQFLIRYLNWLCSLRLLLSHLISEVALRQYAVMSLSKDNFQHYSCDLC